MSAAKPDVYEKMALKYVCPTCKAPVGRWCRHRFWSLTNPRATYLHSPRLHLAYQARKAGTR